MQAILVLASLFAAAVALPRPHDSETYFTMITTIVTYTDLSTPPATITGDSLQISAPLSDPASSQISASSCNQYATVTAKVGGGPEALTSIS